MNKLRYSIATALALSSSLSVAANYSVDARGEAMGGVGVVAGTYLTSPFYNPALAAIYRRNDDVGMLLPAVGLMYSDQDQLQDNAKDLADIIDGIDYGNPGAITPATEAEINNLLTEMKGDHAKVEAGLSAAFGIPNSFLSMTGFAKAYTEAFVSPEIYDSSVLASPINAAQNAELSAMNVVSIGVLEAGLTLAKYQTVFGQHMSFGISPKIQRINTYVYTASVQKYDIKDILKNSTSEAMFNIDVGALWFYGPFRIGISGTNLISRDVATDKITTVLTSQLSSAENTITTDFAYQIRPQYTVGAGFVADYFSFSVDYDINEDEKFDKFADNTQWIRVGMEIDVMRQLQLRGGYRKNLAYSDSEGTVTGGVGISPLGLFELDVAVAYTNADAMGGYVNFLATY
ncbi:conjugal transfer protein TraF [Vibrio sp. MACH09]|uniref:conjugal transfer protein TraF n=1 Tax=Vibrio sp. MACH09 TaxID=3025122 RepID=UPI0027928B89|nr:conjugal transfer protein TraF [Vibrio sp. MACH09]GLO63664.1 conjugal transfer protein TraF [Vibrio sp. MACH09]